MDNHRDIVRRRRTLAYALALLVLTASCSPRIVERIVVQHDTTMVHHRDSIFNRDSIYIREWMKGDTVHIYEYRDRIVYKDRWRDSIVTKVDSFAVETIRTEYVEKPLSWGKRVKLGLFWWVLAVAVGLGVWTFRKPLGGWFTKIVKLIFQGQKI